MDLKDLVNAHKALITERLDPDFGLLDELIGSRSLTTPEVARVKAVPDSYGRSDKLMEYVFERDIYEAFLNALKNTRQTHLANYIRSNGEHRLEFGDDWPLTEREISILDTNGRCLVDLLKTRDLIPHLYSHKVINNRQRDFVSSKIVSHEKNDALLEILRRTSLQDYKKAIRCLRLSEQNHIAMILEEGGGYGSDEENMRNVRHLLIERMDPDCGLLDKLLHLRALTFLQRGIIKSENSIFARNEKLLDLIFKEGRQQALLTALTDTGQKHLFNLVKGNGVYKPEYDATWPLQDRETQIVDNNRCSLVDIMDPCDLITRMFSKGVINNRQYIDINSLPNNTHKSEALLDILRRGSEENYRKAIVCLRESNQSHVAEFLEDGGVLTQVHVSIDGEIEQANVKEHQIVEAMATLLQNTTLPQYQRIRELLDLRIMRARIGHSIVFYIYCKTQDELLRLHELLTIGEFKKRIASVFDLIISKTEATVSEVSWSEEEFNKLKTYFKGFIIKVRSELETDSDATQVEDELITKFTEMLGDRSLGDAARILECSQLSLIAAKRGDNI